MNLKPKETPAAPRTAMGNRLFSALLTLVMVLGLLPVSVFADLADSLSGLAVQSAGTVTYHRKTPEVAILNRYNGNDQSFYKKLIGNTDGNESDRAKYWQYNAVTLFAQRPSGDAAQYSTRATGDVTWDFDMSGYVLKELIEPSKNLEVGASATFYNRTHTHSNYEWKKVRTWTVDLTRFESLSVGIGGSYAPAIGGNLDKSRKYPRVGNFGDIGGGYKTLSYNESNNYCRLHFYPSTHKWFDFEDRECTCSVYAENVLVTFRDTRSPQISNIEYSLNDGKTWTSRYTRAAVGAGRTVKIKLTFDEPIRFADDTNAHGDLFLDLRADGVNKGAYKAYLTELNGNDLIFEYTVPDSQSENALTGDVKIAAIDMDDLFAETKLVQVGKGGAFEITDKTGDGFTTSRCAITDLAGNPMREDEKTIVDANLTLDAGAPYVDTVEFNLNTNNADVKEALGKTDRDDVDYTDASDTHLGVGDSFYLIVHMNERLKGIGMDKENGRYKIDWQHAVFTTNLKDKNGAAVEVRSAYFYSFYDYDYDPTQFITDRVTIGEKWTVDDPKGEIKVTGMRFAEKEGAPGTLDIVTDLAGNGLDMDSVKFKDGANGNPPKLDVDAPEVTELPGSYAVEDTGFRYGVKIADTQTEIADIYGSFILNNGGDGKAYPYKWAVKADSTSAVGENDWTDGITGAAQQFKQTQDVYFYIRPVSGETYVDFSNCTITVKAKDYAGNESNVTLPTGGLKWYIDNLAPTVTAGTVTRALNSGNTSGTLTVEVKLTDGRGISAWQYTWTDSADTEPSEDGWQSGALDDTTSGTVTVKVSENVSAGSIFSKYLWVKAEDNVAGETKNVSDAICLGRFSYDLRGADYELEYPRNFTDHAELKVAKQGPDDTLFFLIPAAEGSEYYAVYKSISAGNYDIFNQTLASGGWKFYKLTVSGQDYILTPDTTQQAEGRLTSLLPGGGDKFSGNLTVTVLAGKSTAYEESETGVLTLGNSSNKFGEDTVNMRLSGYASDLFGAITLTCEGDLGRRDTGSYWMTSDGFQQRTTLEGLRFTVTIGGDKRGWKYENLDWKHSYILLESEDGPRYEIPLDRFQISAEAPNDTVIQTVTVPAGDYRSGVYYASVVIKTISGERDFTAFLGTTTTDIVVDTRQPNSDFSLSSILYAPQANWSGYSKAYGLDQSYGEGGMLECVAGGGVIYLPISQGGTYIGNQPEYYITVTSPNEEDMEQHKTAWTGGDAYTGRYCVQLWNTANAKNKVEIVPYSIYDKVQTDATTQGANVGTPNYGVGFTFDANEQDGKNLYLKTGETNTIAVQKIYENGRKSDIKYYEIMPVDDAVTGKVTIDTDAKQLVFKPDSGVNTVGATVFAWAWQNGQDAIGGEGKRIEMMAYADGWRCALLDEGASYEVITVSAHGSICDAGHAFQRTPWFDDAPAANGSYKDKGVEDLSFTDHKDGTYTLNFRVRDDYKTMQDGLTVNIGFNKEYSDQTFTFTYKGEDINWTTNTGDPTGIYSVTATKGVYGDYFTEAYTAMYMRDWLDVTVEGVFAKVAEGTKMDITVTATDAFGNMGSVGSLVNEVKYAAPAVTGHTMTTVTFNQPVRPVESWAWHEKDGNGFKTEWIQAFPIPGNGTWSIQFRDAFGQTHVATVNTNKFTDTESGIDYSIDLGFSTTDVTKDPVILTTNAANGTVKVYEINGTIHTEMIPVDGFPGIGTQKRQTVISENMETQVELTGINGKNIIRRLRVYIDNIVTGAPKADVHYYVEQLGQEFTAEELTAYVGSGLTVIGNVRAWYTTDRHVTPTGGTGTEFTFTPGGATSHTFTYVDDLGSTGTATAQLPTGLTLQGYVEPPPDTTAPDVDIDLYVKRGGVYTRAEAIPGTTASSDITAKFDALGYVQGYSLTINASDASGFTIAATGGSLTGNVLTITETGPVTITVTDKSSDQNTTTITFTVPDRIDNEPPNAKVVSVPTSLYSKNLYVKVTDNSGEATLVFPVGSEIVPDTTEDKHDKEHKGEYKYEAKDNGTVQFIVRDAAGNTATVPHTVSGIDTEPPKLTVRWSPSAKTYYDEATKTWIDVNSPPSDPVNTNVIAHIESNKAMHGLTVRAGNEKPEQAHTLLEEGIAKSYKILGQDNEPLVTFEVTPEKVTVTYIGNYDQTLTFTATAPNGKSSEVVLNGVTVIDKTAPKITEKQYPMKREIDENNNYQKPYAVWVWLEPDETVTSPNYGGWTSYEQADGTVERLPDEYTDSYPLRITFTENGTYNVRFADEAGNVTIHQVVIDGIDNTAPELTLGTLTDKGQYVELPVTADEDCTVTADGTRYQLAKGTPANIILDQNGTFAITAVDAAGNESFQMVSVGSIDNDPPSISFDNSTIYVMEGSVGEALKAELDKGYKVWDNVTEGVPAPTVDHNGDTAVDLKKAGQYVVTYTVTDNAKNVTTAARFVRVIGKDTVCVSIDGKLILPSSTAVLAPGEHTLTLTNNDQPYSIKARRGILSAGQMKYLSGSSLSFDANGRFTTVNGTGYYTLLVTTQDRQTIRILLYIEQ